jgi:parvulin-like peptidyl-prolyl isomerase
LDFSSILFKVSSGEKEDLAARQLIDSLLTLIKNGSDFAQLAKTYSDDVASATYGGDLGYIKEARLLKVLRR